MGVYGYVPGQAGVRTAKTARHKVVFAGGSIPAYFPGGRTIDATLSRDPSNTDDVSVLQAGLLMGKVTSSGYYAPSILGVIAGAIAAGATSITVSAAVAVEMVRRIGTTGTFKLTGPPIAGGTVVTETITYSAINTTTGVITCTATVNAFVAGSFVQPTDGSEVPIVPIPDCYGIPTLDEDGSTVATVQFAEIAMDALLYTSQIVNWPSEGTLKFWIKKRLNEVGGTKFIFDDAL